MYAVSEILHSHKDATLADLLYTTVAASYTRSMLHQTCYMYAVSETLHLLGQYPSSVPQCTPELQTHGLGAGPVCSPCVDGARLPSYLPVTADLPRSAEVWVLRGRSTSNTLRWQYSHCAPFLCRRPGWQLPVLLRSNRQVGGAALSGVITLINGQE